MERNNNSSWRSDGIDPSLFVSTEPNETKTEVEEPTEQKPNYFPDCPISSELAKQMGFRNFVKVGDKYFPRTEPSNQC